MSFFTTVLYSAFVLGAFPVPVFSSISGNNSTELSHFCEEIHQSCEEFRQNCQGPVQPLASTYSNLTCEKRHEDRRGFCFADAAEVKEEDEQKVDKSQDKEICSILKFMKQGLGKCQDTIRKLREEVKKSVGAVVSTISGLLQDTIDAIFKLVEGLTAMVQKALYPNPPRINETVTSED